MKKRLLIIDDERWFSNLLAYSLEAEGYYDVRQENIPLQAVETARAVGPDLIILDVMMPHLDGSELAERFRHDELLRDVPVLFITNLVSEDDAPDGVVKRNGQIYLSKTAPVERVLECVQEKLGGNVTVARQSSGFTACAAATA
jgi:two-component system OmpR family response regulator